MIDFGLSKFWVEKEHKSKPQKMQTELGTIHFKAPEVLKQNYNFKCDIWSAGVVLYIMLSGNLPFWGEKDEDTNKIILDMNYDFDGIEFSIISKEAKALISKIFTHESKRLTAK